MSRGFPPCWGRCRAPCSHRCGRICWRRRLPHGVTSRHRERRGPVPSDERSPRRPSPHWTTPIRCRRGCRRRASVDPCPIDVALPDVVVDAVYRIARHASTLTEAWYREQLERGIDAFAYVEMVGVVVAVAAVDGFFRSGRARASTSPRGGGRCAPRPSPAGRTGHVELGAGGRAGGSSGGGRAGPERGAGGMGQRLRARRGAVHPGRRDGRTRMESGHAQPRRDGAGRGADSPPSANASFERRRTR